MRADGVFSGGGIKGLAFAGGVQAAAEAGYDEWVQVAGTSAGAITAMMLAVGYDAQGLRKALEMFDFSTIADYGPLGEAQIPINVERLKGATHGKVLSDWIKQLLAQAPRPATKFGDLDPGKRVPDRRRGQNQRRLPVLLRAAEAARRADPQAGRARGRRGLQPVPGIPVR